MKNCKTTFLWLEFTKQSEHTLTHIRPSLYFYLYLDYHPHPSPHPKIKTNPLILTLSLFKLWGHTHTHTDLCAATGRYFFFPIVVVRSLSAAWLCHSALPRRLFSSSSTVLSSSRLKFGTYYRTLLAAIDSAQQASENTHYCPCQQGPETEVCLSGPDIKGEWNYKVHSLVCTVVPHSPAVYCKLVQLLRENWRQDDSDPLAAMLVMLCAQLALRELHEEKKLCAGFLLCVLLDCLYFLRQTWENKPRETRIRLQIRRLFRFGSNTLDSTMHTIPYVSFQASSLYFSPRWYPQT